VNRASKDAGAVSRGSKDDPATARRREQSEKKKPAEEQCFRQMFDKNTLRLTNREAFIESIAAFRRAYEPQPRPFDDADECCARIFTRVRPIFKAELALGDFDAVLVERDRMTLHNCLFHADLKTAYVQHSDMPFDAAFGPTTTNAQVFERGVDPLVRHALEGGLGTLFMFGQTGSGKTYTMASIHENAAQLIFSLVPRVTLRCVELAGKKCLDLLSADRPEIRLRESVGGKVVLEGCSEASVTSASQLLSLLETAASRRKTEATDANDVSSRSHSITSLEVNWSVTQPMPKDARRGGRLLLVDCAGTERKKDSLYHSKDRRQESAEINASLHGLKECIRMRRKKGAQPPYRSNLLTRLLAESFIRSDAELRVIATVSPCATDLEHSLATLRTAYSLSGRPDSLVIETRAEVQKQKKARPVHPRRWSAAQVANWLATVSGGEFAELKAPQNLEGQAMVRWPEVRFAQLCGSPQKGQQLYRLLRDEMAKVEDALRDERQGATSVASVDWRARRAAPAVTQ
jgi:kinesin family protein 2/24